MTEKPRYKVCPVCRGRGYHLCGCWPGDCICGLGDLDCEECNGDGAIDTRDEDVLHAMVPVPNASTPEGAVMVGVDMGSPEGDTSAFYRPRPDGGFEVISAGDYAAALSTTGGVE